MDKIKIYSTRNCLYCIKVINFLNNKNLDYENIDLSDKPDIYNRLKKQTDHKTLPQVFINGNFIGGSDRFFKYWNKNNPYDQVSSMQSKVIKFILIFMSLLMLVNIFLASFRV